MKTRMIYLTITFSVTLGNIGLTVPKQPILEVRTSFQSFNMTCALLYCALLLKSRRKHRRGQNGSYVNQNQKRCKLMRRKHRQRRTFWLRITAC